MCIINNPIRTVTICFGKSSGIQKYGSPGGTFLLISYHLLLTTYYLSLITYYLLLTTYYLSLITYYLLLITYYLLLITFHIIYHPFNGGKPHCTFPVIAVEYGSPYLLVSSRSSNNRKKWWL